MIEVKHVKKVFGSHIVLKDISLQVPGGSVYGLIGRNGAGKTTLLGILAGLMEADGGIVRAEKDGGKVHIGFLPDIPAFFDYLTAEEYIDFLIKNKTRDSVIQRNNLLNLVRLDGRAVIKTMSRGMKQRLGIAAVMVNDPEVILLDEPTSALDPAGRYELMNILKELKEKNKSIILSTHILADMERLCDRVGFLHDGVIKHEMAPDMSGSNFLDLSVSFDVPVNNIVIQLPFCSINKINDYCIEIRCRDSRMEPVRVQQEILGALASMALPVTDIHTLKPSLDMIFQEVCQ